MDSPADIHTRIADVARSLYDSAQDADEPVAHQVVDYAVGEIPGAQYAGITLATSLRHVETPAATHEYPVLLDTFQQRHFEGPCLSAAWHEHTVRVENLETDDRWPDYRRDALNGTPIRSILSFRLFTSEQTIGALNVYADDPQAFDDESEDIGYALATHAALAWDTERREGQFRSALASRDVIGQAKGMLMERFGVDAVRAFELLKKISQDTNTRLADVANQVVATRLAEEHTG
jgi:GAF domain-containing protein